MVQKCVMGTLKVSMDGAPLFSWTGDAADVRATLNAFPVYAVHAGVDVEALADAAIGNYHLIDDRMARLAIRMGITWRVFNLPTNSPMRPGTIGDHVGDEGVTFAVDIAADIRREGPRFRVEEVPLN